MSRWDETNIDDLCENSIGHEEARLLKKFDDYKDLEKRELEKRDHPNNTEPEKGVTMNNWFLLLTIIQAISIVGFTAFLIFFEFVNSKIMNLVLAAALTVLAGEIVIITIFLTKKSFWKNKKSIDENIKPEFDFI